MRFIASPKNYLAGLVALLAVAGAGCGGGGGGHSGRGSNNYNAYVTLQSWSLYDLNGTAVTCADIAARDVVVSYYNADTGTQEPFTDTFPCSNLTGITDYLPAGNYTITVTIYGDPAIYHNNTTVLDQVQSSQLLLGGPNTLPSFNFQINAFDLAWTISVGGVATKCEAVGATSVELDISYAGQSQPVVYTFPCNTYESATTGIAMGTYAIQWQAFLLDASNHELAPGTALTNFTVSSSAPANLGTAIFTP